MTDRPTLYELLPAYLRFRDQSEPLDAPLRALLDVLEREYALLERDIEQLHDDWFIETCQEPLAPFIADLIGVRGLEHATAWVPTQRTRIANALTYRRLKGTLPIVERVVRDVTNWPCVAVPFRHRLARTQHMERVCPERGRSVAVREAGALARLHGPFDGTTRLTQISGGPGLQPATTTRDGFNLPYLGLYLWRLRSYPARQRTAYRMAPGCYTVHPLGYDQPLFAPPRVPAELTDGMTERHAPGPLGRGVLVDELGARRQGREPATDYFGPRPAVSVIDPHTGHPVPWQAIRIANLSQWQRPAAATPDQEGIVLAIDPELGRLAFVQDHPLLREPVLVSHHYGFSGDMGGGPYERVLEADTAAPASGALDDPGEPAEAPDDWFAALRDALEAWPDDQPSAVIQIADNITYGGWRGIDLVIPLRPGRSLTLEAAPGVSPCFLGNLRIVVESGGLASHLTLNGLLLGGQILVTRSEQAGEPVPAGAPTPPDGEQGPSRKPPYRVRLDIRDCTIRAPHDDQMLASSLYCVELDSDPSDGWDLDLRLRSSIVGAVAIPGKSGRLSAQDCILDPGGAWAISGDGRGSPAGPASLTRCTVLGRASATPLSAEDTIFTSAVKVCDRSAGQVSHCYAPLDSELARAEGCQPSVDAGARALAPVFTSETYGDAGYGQLADECPPEIAAGASNGSEMGAFANLRSPFRASNLAGILDEYLPFGLEPRIFHVT